MSRTDLNANCDSQGKGYSYSNLLRPTKFVMFNAPRPAQPYGSGSTNLNGLGGSFVDENPLASSVYDDGLDPWSAAPSPSPPPAPAAPNPNGQSLFKAVICTSLSLRGHAMWLQKLDGLKLTLWGTWVYRFRGRVWYDLCPMISFLAFVPCGVMRLGTES